MIKQLPRGNLKSFLLAHVLPRSLTEFNFQLNFANDLLLDYIVKDKSVILPENVTSFIYDLLVLELFDDQTCLKKDTKIKVAEDRTYSTDDWIEAFKVKLNTLIDFYAKETINLYPEKTVEAYKLELQKYVQQRFLEKVFALGTYFFKMEDGQNSLIISTGNGNYLEFAGIPRKLDFEF